MSRKIDPDNLQAQFEKYPWETYGEYLQRHELHVRKLKEWELQKGDKGNGSSS